MVQKQTLRIIIPIYFCSLHSVKSTRWCSSIDCSSNIQDNIDKTRKKAGMTFSANFDHHKVSSLMYVKFWWQACLPTLLYHSELFTLTLSLSEKLERCQLWFIGNIFHVLKFTLKLLFLKLSGLNSTESEIAIKKMLFLGRLILGA